MRGDLHPSLRLYIQCFDSPPFPRVYPRAGGMFDQDPVLMRDFRMIRDFEVQWKQAREQMRGIHANNVPDQFQREESAPDLEGMLNEMLREQGLEDDAYF